MPDLDAAIRRDLDYRRTQLVDPDNPTAEIAFEGMRDAILAALDDHATDSLGRCTRCGEWDEGGDGAWRMGHAWLCSTKVAIAAALEVEASDA